MTHLTHFDWAQSAIERGACVDEPRTNQLSEVTCILCANRLQATVESWEDLRDGSKNGDPDYCPPHTKGAE